MSYAAYLHRQVVLKLSAKKLRQGTLKHAAGDYLVLEEDDTQDLWIVPVEHVQQVTAFGLPAAAGAQPADASLVPGQLADVLQQAKQSVVRLESGGCEPMTGYLADAANDFLVLCTVPDGYVYVPVRHVLALSIVNAAVQPEFLEWMEKTKDGRVPAASLETLLQGLIGKRIQLGRGSPAAVTGVLKTVRENVLELVTAPHETTLVPLHHLKAVTCWQPSGWSSDTSL